MAPHNVCGPVGTMANVHFAVATPNYKVLEHFNDFADPVGPRARRSTRRSVAVEDGCFGLPERPGLGLRLNHEACRRAPAHRRNAEAVRGWLGKSARVSAPDQLSSLKSQSLTGSTLELQVRAMETRGLRLRPL